MGPQGAPAGSGPARVGIDALDLGDPAAVRPAGRRRPQWPGAPPPDGKQVGRAIADIVEAALTEAVDQFGRLGGTLEVMVAIAGEDLGETDAVGEGLGDALIGGGGQNQQAA